MFELSNLHLHITIVCLTKSCLNTDKIASQPLRIDEWHQETLLVDGAEHGEPFHADHSELLVLVV